MIKLHFTPDFFNNVLCGSNMEGELDDNYHYWLRSDVLDWAEKRAGIGYVACEECINHPDYPFHLLNRTEL